MGRVPPPWSSRRTSLVERSIAADAFHGLSSGSDAVTAKAGASAGRTAKGATI